MEKAGKRLILKWMVYAATLVLFSALSTTPNFFEFWGVKPFWALPLCVCIAMHENEKTAAIIGGLGGALMAFTAGRFIGFYAAALVVMCVAVSLFTMYYVKNSLLWGAIFTLGSATILLMLDWTFWELIWNGRESFAVLKTYYFPQIAYTTVVAIPIYFLVRFYYRKLEILIE